MKARLNCREATALVLAGEDRRLSFGERAGVRLHMLVCTACSRFERQGGLMRRALRRWKSGAEEG